MWNGGRFGLHSPASFHHSFEEKFDMVINQPNTRRSNLFNSFSFLATQSKSSFFVCCFDFLFCLFCYGFFRVCFVFWLVFRQLHFNPLMQDFSLELWVIADRLIFVERKNLLECLKAFEFSQKTHFTFWKNNSRVF